MRGGFGSRTNRGGQGFGERLAQPTSIDSFEHALFPSNRRYHYFPPQMVTNAGPRIPTAAFESCQQRRPLAAFMLFPHNEDTMLSSVEGTTTSAVAGAPSATSLRDLCRNFDECKAVASKIPMDDDDVLKTFQSNPQLFGLAQSQLPPELRVWGPSRSALTDAEKKKLYAIKPQKKRRIEKPVRRGGVVVAGGAPVSGAKKQPVTSSSSGVTSGLVGGDVPSASGGVGDGNDVEGGARKGKRPRGDDDEALNAEGTKEDDDENSVSSVDNDDDDADGLDDGSAEGSGGEDFTF